MMREGSGAVTLAVCEPRHVSWVRGGQVSAQVRHITLTGETDSWFTRCSPEHRSAGRI